MSTELELKFFNALLPLARIASDQNLLEDAASVLEAIRALRPDELELGLLQAEIAAKSGEYIEAIRMLGEVESSPTHWSQAKALKASCQYLSEDPAWEITCNEVLWRDDASAEAIAFVKRLQDAEISLPHDENEAPAAAMLIPAMTIHFNSGYIRA